MTYREAIDYIHSVSWRGSVPGLSRIAELCERLGHPERGLRCIHIAGTNGKGSTAALLTSILRAAGYRVGTFTSPYVRTFNERIAIDGEPVSDYLLAKAVEAVRPHADAMTDHPTEFELITAVGFEIFRRKHCDIVVLEVGLGGRYDSTNVIEDPVVSVITGIAFDHMQLLGNTLGEIASEKAGIIKYRRPVVTAALDPEAAAVIEAEAAAKEAPLRTVSPERIKVGAQSLGGILMDYKGHTGLCTGLVGSYQPKNIALVCEVVHALEENGYAVGEDALYRGVAEAKWPARFEPLQKDPPVVFDGGHNEEGVTAAIATAKKVFAGRKPVLLTGVLADKAYEKMADVIAPAVSEVFTMRPDNPRALSAEDLAAVYTVRGVPAHSFATISEALDAARRRAEKLGLPLLILGSLYLYKDIYRHFR